MQKEILFVDTTDELNEILIAELTVIGFESFWESESGLRGYIDEAVDYGEALDKLTQRYNITCSEQSITSQTWDVANEDQVEVVVITPSCVVRGSHCEAQGVEYEMVVDPKLAFGSGKHPSTQLCLEYQLEIDHRAKSVVDIGTGSGILAVMAEKRGAAHIDAFDNNPWAIEIVSETLRLNQSERVVAMAGEMDDLNLSVPYDLALANLNEAVIREYLPSFLKLLTSGSYLLLSGYMEKDRDAINVIAQNNGLELVGEKRKDDWVAAYYRMS